MSIFSKTRVGKVIRVNGGVLQNKFAMIAKEFKEGVAVVVEQSDWPSEAPTSYNALYIDNARVTELSEEEQTLLKIKFPHPDQFEQ